MYDKLLKEILSHKDIAKANILSNFFKTGKGEYGEGDLFLGITVPVSRKIAIKYKDLSFKDISRLIKNQFHEVRLVAILILVLKYKASHRLDLWEEEGKKIVDFYLAHTKYINNWDLVDLSAHYILGDYLWQRTVLLQHKDILTQLAKSQNIWERRIAIVSTFAFIYKGESKWTFRIVLLLMNDKHDLIHKACGWMLREVGKRVSLEDLTSFLDKYTHQMPRTMLRYAIERLPENKRLYYLKK